MTEQEWLAGKRSYDLIYHPKCRDDRKRRLLACACARRVLPFLHDERFARVVAECERYADAEIDWAEMLAVRKLFRAARADLDSARGLEYQNHAAGAVGAITAKEFMSFKMAIEAAQHAIGAHSRPAFMEGCATEATEQLALARDIFVNPFRRPVFDPSWRTDTALSLARQMYEGQEFSAMPILADALQDVGCDSADILAHCRGSGPHVRGCWVVDLVLGKS